MLAEIRELLRETTAATSYWSDALLLILFNQAMDLRVMQLAESHEGWVTDSLVTDIVADQREYSLPEGAGRVKRIIRIFSPGTTNAVEQPLIRNERWSDATPVQSGVTALGGGGTVPTYRMLGELIILEPTPQESITDGLKIECEFAPSRFTTGTDKLDLRFPDSTETLLIYDSVVAALENEAAQGNEPENLEDMRRARQRYESIWASYIEQRTYGRVFSEPFYMGD